MDEITLRQPPRRTKFLFWLILGSISVFFAEVVSGSDMFPYFTLWGWIAEIPLYTLHILVLSSISFSHGKPRFYTLFIAGAIFGMYEAYITKVLWNPPWGPPFISIGGVAVVEVLILVLWWHPFMAFIVPLFVAENILTGSREMVSILPDRFRQQFYGRKNYLPLLALSGGLLQSAGSSSPAYSLLSGVSTTAFIMLLIYIWKTKENGKGYTLRELLPSRKELLVLISLLLTLYLVMGIFLRREALPGIFPQLIIWLMYGGLFALLYLHLRKPHPVSETWDLPFSFSWKTCIFLSLIFTLTSTISTAIHIGILMMAAMWIAGSIIGVSLFVRSIKDVSIGLSAGKPSD